MYIYIHLYNPKNTENLSSATLKIHDPFQAASACQRSATCVHGNHMAVRTLLPGRICRRAPPNLWLTGWFTTPSHGVMDVRTGETSVNIKQRLYDLYPSWARTGFGNNKHEIWKLDKTGVSTLGRTK